MVRTDPAVSASHNHLYSLTPSANPSSLREEAQSGNNRIKVEDYHDLFLIRTLISEEV